MIQPAVVMMFASTLLGLTAAEDPATLSKDAQAVIATAEKEVVKNRTAYDEANKRPLDAAEKALRQELDRLTKAGKLDEAVALKKVIEGFRDDLVAKVDERAQNRSDDMLGGASGHILVIEGKTVTEWDNAAPVQITRNPHEIVFGLRFAAPLSRFWFRARPGYGSERISYAFDGGTPMGTVWECDVNLKAAKSLIRIKGTHSGSNDAFMYGVLQYKESETGEWKNIPPAMIVTLRK